MQADHGRILYDGWSTSPDTQICVTTRWCFVNGSRYPVSELELLGSSRGQRDLLHFRRAFALFAVALTLALVFIAIGSEWTKTLWIAVAASAAATVAITALPAALGNFLRRPIQIWALYQGSPVLLFATRDREQHGQVARALIRAREMTGG